MRASQRTAPGFFRWGIIAAAVVLACDDVTGVHPRPGITIDVAGSLTDTVAAPPTLLTIYVRDSANAPIPAAAVRFTTPEEPPPIFFVTNDTNRALVAGGPTDSEGRVRALLLHATDAGEGWLRVEARQDGVLLYSDSVKVVTLPGKPDSLLISPRDTTLYQGNNGPVTVRVADAFGNPRGETATLEAATTGISVNGTTVTATTGPSRQVVRGRYQSIVDSAFVSIVPRGTIVVRTLEPGAGIDIPVFATLGLDGSAYTGVLFKGAPNFFGAWSKQMGPHWSPAGDYLTFFDGSSNQQIFRLTLTGVATPLFSARLTPENDIWQQMSADGQWIYFEGTARICSSTSIYRARMDGSALTRLSPGAPICYQNDLYPSPSPDGTSVVFTTDRPPRTTSAYRLWILDLATGVTRDLGVSGTGARWSPQGDWIAFENAYKLFVVRPDGSALRQISPVGANYEPWVSWSPDGKWIVAEHWGPRLEIIEVATGLRLPLGFSDWMGTPAWKP